MGLSYSILRKCRSFRASFKSKEKGNESRNMKQVTRTWLALQLAYHWNYILRLRRRGDRLLQTGTPLSSPRLLALSRKADPHGVAIFLLDRQYKQLETL